MYFRRVWWPYLWCASYLCAIGTSRRCHFVPATSLPDNQLVSRHDSLQLHQPLTLPQTWLKQQIWQLTIFSLTRSKVRSIRLAPKMEVELSCLYLPSCTVHCPVRCHCFCGFCITDWLIGRSLVWKYINIIAMFNSLTAMDAVRLLKKPVFIW